MPTLNTTHLDELIFAIQCIDHTTLEGKDTLNTIEVLCNKAIQPAENIPSVASVCLYPSWVEIAKKLTMDSDVKVTSVATGFPAGNTFLEVKALETQMAINAGADEIDMVISRGQLMMGNHEFVRNEIRTIRTISKDNVLKVILETGELVTEELIRNASFISMEEGADFIKTSTGKIQPAATLEVSRIMLECIKEYESSDKRKVGFKAAGGIRKASEALAYIDLVLQIVGEEWLDPSLFRIGASSLTNNLVHAIQEIRTQGQFTEATSNSSTY